MLQKERWLFDPKRGLPRDTKNPQQSDQPLRSFEQHQHKIVEDNIAPRKKVIRRPRGKSKPAVVPVVVPENVSSDEEEPVTHRSKRGRNGGGAVVVDNKSDDNVVFDIDNNVQTKKSKQQPQLPPRVPLSVSNLTHADVDSILDTKLQSFLSLFANQQSKMEQQMQKQLTKALDDQKKELLKIHSARLPISSLNFPSSTSQFQPG